MPPPKKKKGGKKKKGKGDDDGSGGSSDGDEDGDGGEEKTKDKDGESKAAAPAATLPGFDPAKMTPIFYGYTPRLAVDEDKAREAKFHADWDMIQLEDTSGGQLNDDLSKAEAKWAKKEEARKARLDSHLASPPLFTPFHTLHSQLLVTPAMARKARLVAAVSFEEQAGERAASASRCSRWSSARDMSRSSSYGNVNGIWRVINLSKNFHCNCSLSCNYFRIIKRMDKSKPFFLANSQSFFI